MLPLVMLVGRPNTGKSTLFNRLIGKRLALVSDRPGMTRDWREGLAHLGDISFRLIDCAGMEEFPQDEQSHHAIKNSEQLLFDADVILFVVDMRDEILPDDEILARRLHKLGKKVILLANKSESVARSLASLEAFRLGFGEPLPISGLHGSGLEMLYEEISPFCEPPHEGDTEEIIDEEADREEPEAPLHFAILGCPNTGKSTLFNRLIGKDRVLTGPIAGLTRDSISETCDWQGHSITIFDTAGLRRASKAVQAVEKISAAQSHHTLRFAHIVAIIADAGSFPLKQDLQLMAEAATQGRALMLLVNKWDQVKEQKKTLANTRIALERAFPDIGDIPIITLSALYDKNFDIIFETAWRIFQLWQRRISTARLNTWLAETVERHPPPIYQGRRVRLRYMTQIAARPPRFALWISRKGGLSDSYQRYLVNALRRDFDWPATPLRVMTRKSPNPYKS